MITRLMLVFLIFLSGVTLAQAKRKQLADLNVSGLYTERWSNTSNLKMSQALVAANARDCGELWYKWNIHNVRPDDPDGDYLAYCTADGDHWTAYLLYLNVSMVIGPMDIDPRIAPPSSEDRGDQ